MMSSSKLNQFYIPGCSGLAFFKSVLSTFDWSSSVIEQF